MRFLAISIILVCASSATYAQEQSTKPGMVGTWNSTNDSLGCRYLPRSMIIRFAGDRRAEAEMLTNELGNWRWRKEPEELDQVVGPTTGPDYMRFRFKTWQLLDQSHLNLAVTGIEGPDHCEYVRAETSPGSPQP